MIEKFVEWADKKHEYAKEWKRRTGGKVIGYICTYAPEEIMYAAGILPVRIFGSHEPGGLSLIEPHIFGKYCPLCRDCLAQGLQGRYDYLDGIMIAQSCLHIRQTYWSWQRHIPVDYNYYLYMPHGNRPVGGYEYLKKELIDFKDSLEEWLGKEITEEDLSRSIEIYNNNRRLMRRLYEFRKKPNPPITGSEVMEIAISNQVVDKQEHSEALEELLKELPERKISRETGTRLMIIGSENDDRSFMRMVEGEISFPTTFVVEENCVGSRYFWNEVIPEEDRLMAIAKRYLDRPPCPSKDWPDRQRFPHLLNLIREFNVEGAILLIQKFCHPHELDIPALEKYLGENNIPFYVLESDITMPLGQFRTRIEAFLESKVGIV